MAYDHNFKKKRNAQKAAEETFEPKSQRDKRLLSVGAKKATWLAMLLLAAISVAAFVVIDHFGSQGVRSEQKALSKDAVVDTAQPRPQAEIKDPLQKLMATSAQVSGQETSERPADTTDSADAVVGDDTHQSSDLGSLHADADKNAVKHSNRQADKEPDKGENKDEGREKGIESAEVLSKPEIASKATPPASQVNAMPVRSLNDFDDLPVDSDAKQTPVVTAFSVPHKEDFEAEMTFYDELKKQEVVIDKTAKQPIMFDKPYYILAGSFDSEARAIRERERLRKHGQELKIVKVGNIYQLETEPYYNSLKFGARKNALSKAGASVAKRLARKPSAVAKPSE